MKIDTSNLTSNIKTDTKNYKPSTYKILALEN